MSDSPTVHFISVTDAASERKLYDEVSQIIRQAREAVYFTGTGFQHEERAKLHRQLRLAEEDALGRQIRVTRIHAGSVVAPSWAAAYADLLEHFPQYFELFIDFDSTHYSDIGLIDPYGYDPVVCLLFGAPEPFAFGSTNRPSILVMIEGASSFARGLCQQFDSRAKELIPLGPKDVRDLAARYIYFGWGVHMASRSVRRDIPDARRLGVATLRGWRRDTSSLLVGPADGATSIYHTGDPADAFEGVVYEITWWAKTRLDRLEGRTYQSVPVVIEFAGNNLDAFTYVALPSQRPDQPLPYNSWIRSIVEGAQENNMTGLLAELHELGVSK